jgi:methyl-accepting chemotaxis protein
MRTGINKKTFKLTIKIKLIIAFLCIAILPITIVGTFSYDVAKNTVQKKAEVFTRQLLNQVSLNLQKKYQIYHTT